MLLLNLNTLYIEQSCYWRQTASSPDAECRCTSWSDVINV